MLRHRRDDSCGIKSNTSIIMGFNLPEHLANLYRVLAKPEGLTENK